MLTCGKTGNIYDCTWEESKRSGLGIALFVASGDFYKGLFQDDKMEGFGCYYEARAQELYLGQFQAGVRQGEGYLIRTVPGTSRLQPQYYVGAFKAGKPDGQGQHLLEQPDLAQIMDKSGFTLDAWNAFETKISVNKEVIRALGVRSSNLTTVEKKSKE